MTCARPLFISPPPCLGRRRFDGDGVGWERAVTGRTVGIGMFFGRTGGG